MKVLMIDPSDRGGMAYYTYSLCESLARGGADVVLLTAPGYELESKERSFGLRMELSREQSLRDYYGTIRRVVNDESPDIVHVQTIYSLRKDWLRMMLWGAFRKTLVYTVHNVMPHETARFYRFCSRRMYGCIQHLIVHADENRRRLIREFGVWASRIEVIPLGGYEFFLSGRPKPKREARRKIDIAPGKRVALCMGTIRKYKGIDVLIRAFEMVANQVPDALLLIVGAPVMDDAEPYAALIRDLGLQESVVFRPEYVSMEEMALYAAATDVFVLPYLRTAQTAVIPMAYSFGRPVLATTAGGLPEVVEDGRCGRLVEPGDFLLLGRTLAEMLGDRNMLKQMGQRARTLAKTTFSWATIAQKTRQLYSEILKDS